jgi:hypothetical protein
MPIRLRHHGQQHLLSADRSASMAKKHLGSTEKLNDRFWLFADIPRGVTERPLCARKPTSRPLLRNNGHPMTAYRSGEDVFGSGSGGPILTRLGHSAQVKSDPEGPLQTSEMARLGSRNSLLPTLPQWAQHREAGAHERTRVATSTFHR